MNNAQLTNKQLKELRRNSADYDPSKCPCRIWVAHGKKRTGGLPNVQCSNNLPDGCDMCTMHSNMRDEGGLSFGLVTGELPSEPIIHMGKEHFWDPLLVQELHQKKVIAYKDNQIHEYQEALEHWVLIAQSEEKKRRFLEDQLTRLLEKESAQSEVVCDVQEEGRVGSSTYQHPINGDLAPTGFRWKPVPHGTIIPMEVDGYYLSLQGG